VPLSLTVSVRVLESSASAEKSHTYEMQVELGPYHVATQPPKAALLVRHAASIANEFQEGLLTQVSYKLRPPYLLVCQPVQSEGMPF
jgi:hypothetical protein